MSGKTTDAEIKLVQRHCRKLESHLMEAIDKFEFDEEMPDDLAVVSTQMALLTTALWHRCIYSMIVEDDAGNRRVATPDELPDIHKDRKNWMRMSGDLFRDFHGF